MQEMCDVFLIIVILQVFDFVCTKWGVEDLSFFPAVPPGRGAHPGFLQTFNGYMRVTIPHSCGFDDFRLESKRQVF